MGGGHVEPVEGAPAPAPAAEFVMAEVSRYSSTANGSHSPWMSADDCGTRERKRA
jgi:hypothetical protein